MHIVVLWVMTVGQSAKWPPHIGGICGWHHNSEKIFFVVVVEKTRFERGLNAENKNCF